MSRSRRDQAVTLLELILAVSLLSMIALGFVSIDLFSRNSVLSADRQAKVQNSVAFAMSHMAKTITTAVGDKNNPPVTFPATAGAEAYPAIVIKVDSNNNGRRDDAPDDKQVAYYYNSTAYTLNYCADYPTCASNEVLSNKIVSNLNTANVTVSDFSTCCDSCAEQCTNYVGIRLTGRWNPSNSTSPQNPEVTLYSYIKMPLVSVN